MLPGPALVEALDRKFGNVWLSHGGMQINVSCPFCPRNGKGVDTTGHLGMNFSLQVWHCVRCDAGGRLKNLLEKNGVDHALRALSLHDVANLRTTIDRIANPRIAPYVPPMLDMDRFPRARRVLPDDFSRTTVFGESLRGKGISLEEAERHAMCACEHGKQAGYVIFPFFEATDEQPVYWQGRDAIGGERLRKLNPSVEACAQGKAHWLYNFEFAVRGGDVYLVEGTLDAVSLQTWLTRHRGEGHTALSLQGTALSFPSPDVHPLNTQYGKLVSLRPRTVHVVFDSDAWTKSQELAAVLATCGLRTRPVRLFGGDPNELRETIGQFLDEGKSLTAQLKRATF